MKRLLRLRPALRLLSAATLVSVLSHCDRQKDSAPAPAGPPAKAAAMTDHAEKLGFAAKLPLDTEFYLGSVHLKKHLANLQNSAWWKDLNALVQDKTPAPTAGDKTLEALKALWGDEFFLAGGVGFAQKVTVLRDFNRAYNEIYFKLLMSGTTFSIEGDTAGPSPLRYLQMFLQEPALLEKAANFITAFELPPLLAGLKAQKTDAVLAQIESGLKDFEAKKIVILSDLALPQGGKLRVATVDMAKLLPESAQAVALNNLPKNTPDETRKLVEQTYDAVQAKRFQFAWGALDGYVILACGKNLDHVRFVQSPATSVLAKPEMAWLAPHVQKNLLGISYLSAGTLSALNDDQPTVPMLRGVVSAMKESPTFKTMAESLEKRTAELSKTESAVYSAEATNLVAAAWWDRGLEAEFVGGLKPRFCLPGKPLKYQGLINLPGVFFGLAYHRDKGYDSLVRTWMEQLVGLVYTGAQELVKAGIAGPSGGQQFALFEMMLLPTFQKIYQADKDINDKGLGSEAAYIVDLNGKTPPLPGLPPAAKDMKFPRITTVSDIADRTELDKGWQSINDTVTTIASLAGSFAGASQPGTAPGQPAFVMPKPESIQSGDITTWYYKTDIFTGDLQPCAALNAQRLILSTSKAAAQSVATELATPSAKNVDGLVWKLDPGVAAELLTSSAAPSQTPEQAKELKQTLKWIKPFHAATGRIYEQSGQWHSTLKWEITDVVKFD
ncbi:MAG: hypothetical protein ACOYOF_16495 [Verrucomicrobiaceae bacterium]